MNKIKKILLAVFIAGSMGLVSGYSTVAVAQESEGLSVEEAIAKTIEHIDRGIEAAQKGNKDLLLEHIENARQMSKEITGDDKGMAIQKGGSKLRKAKTAAKKHNDVTGAGHLLGEAKKIYGEM